MVEVVNMTRSPHVFAAWTEDEGPAGTWSPVTSHKHSATLTPGQKDVFPLIKPEKGKARIAVIHGRVRTNRLDQWVDSGKALIGMRPRTKHIFIEVP